LYFFKVLGLKKKFSMDRELALIHTYVCSVLIYTSLQKIKLILDGPRIIISLIEILYSIYVYVF